MFYYTKRCYEEDIFAIEEYYCKLEEGIKIKEKLRRNISSSKFSLNIGKSVESIIDSDFDEVVDYIPPSIAELKTKKYAEIDYNTGKLISAGFIYDGKTFSLSLSAQANWHAIMNQKSEFTDPIPISTIYNDTYQLAVSDVEDFWRAGKTALEGHLTTGRTLKKAVFDAINESEIKVVVDNR